MFRSREIPIVQVTLLLDRGRASVNDVDVRLLFGVVRHSGSEHRLLDFGGLIEVSSSGGDLFGCAKLGKQRKMIGINLSLCI